MQTIPAREIKRRGIGAVDYVLKHGAAHVLKNDQPRYVILDEARYQELLEAEEAATTARTRAALEDERAGRMRRVSAQQLIAEYELDG